MSGTMVTTNVSDAMISVENRGCIIMIKKADLSHAPHSLIATLSESSEYYNECTKRYIFNQNTVIFNSVMDFYNHGELHIPDNICPWLLQKELEFWRIPSSHLHNCCMDELREKTENYDNVNFVFQQLDQRLEEASKGLDKNSLRYRVWNFLNNPPSSRNAIVRIRNYLIDMRMYVVISVIYCMQPRLHITGSLWYCLWWWGY